MNFEALSATQVDSLKKTAKIAIAAVSARPFVQAAVAAGYEVIALDAFADMETEELASCWYQLQFANGSFDDPRLPDMLQQLVLAGVRGLVYGSGFEARPELLGLIGNRLPLIGNSLRVVRNMKRALTFFALLDALGVRHPEVSLRAVPPEQAAGWLYKRGGGSGGTHIRHRDASVPPEHGYYYQRELQGTPVSFLFAADGHDVHDIGFNQQWLAPTASMPYRYGGAVSHAVLPLVVQQEFRQAAQKLTAAVGLRGLNSLDGIMHNDELWLLELNPRLSASFDLYETPHGQLFELHLQAASGRFPQRLQFNENAKAHHIVYTTKEVQLPAAFDWPVWVADIPPAERRIAAGEPLCTVLATADTAGQAVTLIADRVARLIKKLPP